jgi:DNA repair exonuclease SbcCD ATPase subunit
MDGKISESDLPKGIDFLNVNHTKEFKAKYRENKETLDDTDKCLIYHAMNDDNQADDTVSYVNSPNGDFTVTKNLISKWHPRQLQAEFNAKPQSSIIQSDIEDELRDLADEMNEDYADDVDFADDGSDNNTVTELEAVLNDREAQLPQRDSERLDILRDGVSQLDTLREEAYEARVENLKGENGSLKDENHGLKDKLVMLQKEVDEKIDLLYKVKKSGQADHQTILDLTEQHEKVRSRANAMKERMKNAHENDSKKLKQLSSENAQLKQLSSENAQLKQQLNRQAQVAERRITELNAKTDTVLAEHAIHKAKADLYQRQTGEMELLKRSNVKLNKSLSDAHAAYCTSFSDRLANATDTTRHADVIKRYEYYRSKYAA